MDLKANVQIIQSIRGFRMITVGMIRNLIRWLAVALFLVSCLSDPPSSSNDLPTVTTKYGIWIKPTEIATFDSVCVVIVMNEDSLHKVFLPGSQDAQGKIRYEIVALENTLVKVYANVWYQGTSIAIQQGSFVSGQAPEIEQVVLSPILNMSSLYRETKSGFLLNLSAQTPGWSSEPHISIDRQGYGIWDTMIQGSTFSSWENWGLPFNSTVTAYVRVSDELDHHFVYPFTVISSDTIIDARDGKVYRMSMIGNQVWMSENLHYATENYFCYENDSQNCDMDGYLYTWSDAMALGDSCDTSDCSSLIEQKHQGICPIGWRIPSKTDWDTLQTVVLRGSNIKAVIDWNDFWNDEPYNMKDIFAFSAYPAGFRKNDGDWSSRGYNSRMWSSTQTTKESAWHRSVMWNDVVFREFMDVKGLAMPVRCIKNSP
jgi:uncharacterized protein (TIGR02145 family)